VTCAPLCVYTSVIFLYYIRGQPKRHLRIGHDGPEGEYRNSATPSLTSVLDWDGCSTQLPVRFRSGNTTVPIVQEAGWAPGPVWTCAENLATTRIRSPDRQGRDNSLSRLTLLLHMKLKFYIYIYTYSVDFKQLWPGVPQNSV